MGQGALPIPHGKFILILVISFRLSMMGRRLSWAFWRGLGRRM